MEETMNWSFYLILVIQSKKQYLHFPHFPVIAFASLNFMDIAISKNVWVCSQSEIQKA